MRKLISGNRKSRFRLIEFGRDTAYCVLTTTGRTAACIKSVRQITRLTILALVMMVSVTVFSQDAPISADDTGIYVTTQDFLNLREGPGTAFEALAIVEPEMTLMAIGRSSDTRWVQVRLDDGRTGWLAVRYLVYSGDVVQLQVDGINPVPFIRQATAIGITTREATIYDRVGHPVGTVPVGTRLEFTGRLGSGLYSRYQYLDENGNLGWIAAWDVRIVSGRTSRLFDTAYLYPYGRIMRRLDEDISNTVNSLNTIEDRWRRVDGGSSATCDHIPDLVVRTVTDADVQQEVLIEPAIIALDTAIENTNLAIVGFEDACVRVTTGDREYVTRGDVREALANVNEARLNLNLVDSMFLPLQRRDPLISILSGQR